MDQLHSKVGLYAAELDNSLEEEEAGDPQV